MNENVLTLENEVKEFANKLPYWAKYLAEKILSGKLILQSDIDMSYSYLLQDLKLLDKTERPEITIRYKLENIGNYKTDLYLTKLCNVEGVNGLIENQIIKFNPKLTIIYGTNGAGKSGYVRLLKNVFYSKAPEEILPNIHITCKPKPLNATFNFISNNTNITMSYVDKNRAEFEQFSIFDGKGLFQQLSEKNEFEFRPAGLSFFSDYAEAVKQIEQKHNTQIQSRQSVNEYTILFEGDSEIKTFIESLSKNTKVEDLSKYTPFSHENKVAKTKIQKQYDELLLASKSKEKEIKELENIKKFLENNKKEIEHNNHYFTAEYLYKIKSAINECIEKEATAKAEGIEKFKTDKIGGVGTVEWINFIISANVFAKCQKSKDVMYPENGDNCLFCHQKLPENAKNLIENYWIFIKSLSEENAIKAQEILNKEMQIYEKINFNLFPDENILTIWLSKKFPKELESLIINLTNQQKLAKNIITDIQNKIPNSRNELKINMLDHIKIEKAIDSLIIGFKDDNQNKELGNLLKEKIFLEHKEKFNIHFSKFKTYVKNQIWIEKASKVNYAKRKITEVEKLLSDKYFNQKYVNAFNVECQNLNGNFGIDIKYTGSAGKSYRQLKLKGKNPNAVLSEGEQKVIAIADFMAETQLSEVNRGIIFDDPVTSLDDIRKSVIANRLVNESISKQVIIFTHDLVFVSSLIGHCSDLEVKYSCHWIENRNGKPGQVWLDNSPSYEKEYRNAEPARKHYIEAKKDDCEPAKREGHIRSGFTALRTCYEVLVINDLFNNVVQRFNERISVDALSKVYFNAEIIEELQDSFGQCCRYMEGHTHSDKYSYKKPEPQNLNEEIERYEAIRSRIKKAKK